MKKYTGILLICGVFSGSASGTLITNNALFGVGAVTESFEGITVGQMSVRVVSPMLFPSGVTILEPTPARFDSFDPFIVSGGFFGQPPPPFPELPDGNSYLGQANAGAFDNGIVFEFPGLMRRVGAFMVDSSLAGSAMLTLSAYDVNTNLIEQTTLAGALVADWTNSFLGFESNTGIRRFRIEGDGSGVLRLDMLHFEAIPEPTTFVMFLLGGLWLFMQRKRCRKKT